MSASVITFEDTEFVTEFPVADYTGQDIRRTDEGKVQIAYLSYEECPEYEFEDGVEFKEFTTQIARDEFYGQMAILHGVSRVFIVEHYEHSGHHYSLVGEGNYPDRQFDVRPSVVLVVPDDATEPREYAQGILDEYNAYLAGEVYGVVVETFEPDGTPVDCDAVWGYIGTEYALEEMKAMAA